MSNKKRSASQYANPEIAKPILLKPIKPLIYCHINYVEHSKANKKKWTIIFYFSTPNRLWASQRLDLDTPDIFFKFLQPTLIHIFGQVNLFLFVRRLHFCFACVRHRIINHLSNTYRRRSQWPRTLTRSPKSTQKSSFAMIIFQAVQIDWLTCKRFEGNRSGGLFIWCEQTLALARSSGWR